MIDQQLLNKLYASDSQRLNQILEPTPQQVIPVVTQSNSDDGYMFRYFVRQVTDDTFIVEVDKNQYDRFKQNPRFVVAEIKWKIVGRLDTITYPNGANLYGVKDLNKIAVANADLTFGGLMKYIYDYGEFWLRE